MRRVPKVVHINHRLSVSSNLGKLNLCSEKGIAATCTNTCIGANTGASGECIACPGVERR